MQNIPEHQQSYPQTTINMTPDSMLLTITLAPGTAISQIFGEEMMNQIVAKWLETRREIKKQKEIVDFVKRSK